jgi:class 3 adenylate cyclase
MGPTEAPSIGRQYERTRLEVRLDEARAGQPRVVLVTGEAGIGKTTLVHDLVATAARQQCRVLTARCVQGLALPYAPLGGSIFPEISSRLARWCRDTPTFEPLRSFIASWPAAPAADLAEADGLHIRLLLGEALLRLVDEEPVVLVVDDLHWSDRSTADLLLQIALRANDRATLEPVRLLVVATFRESELGWLETNVARLRREPSCSTLELRGLDRVETGLLLDRAGVAPIAPEFLAHVHYLSGGNPLYVEALAHSSTSSAASARSGAELPFEIRGMVSSVVAGLDASSQEVLRTAAVLGDAFSRDQLGAVLDLPTDTVDRALDAACRHGLLNWSDADIAEFAHPLYSEAMRRALSARERRSQHAQIAEALTRIPDSVSVAVIAAHYVGAGAEADPTKALAVLTAAARQAEELFAWEEAARFLEAALALRRELPIDAAGVELEHRLGIARMYSGSAGSGLEHLLVAREAAETLGLNVESAQVLVDELHCEAIARRPSLDPDVDYEGRFADLEPSHPALACHGMAELAQWRWAALDFDGGERLARRALEMAQHHEAHEALESAQRSLAMIDWRHLRVESSRVRLGLANMHARATGDRKLEVGSSCRLPPTMIWCGDVSGARAAVDEATRIVRETNYLVEEGFVLLSLAYLDVIEGALGVALERLMGIFILERITGYSWVSTLSRALFARVRTLRGEWADARLAIEEWDAAAGGRPQRSAMALGSLVHAGEGDADARSMVQDQVIGVDASWRSIGDDSAAAALIEAAYVCGAPGSVAGAMSLLQALQDDGQVFTTTFVQLIPRVVGEGLLVEGRLREARAQLSDAAAVASKLGALPELAMCLYSLARVHVEVDELPEAERYLKEAARLAQGHKLHVAQRALALARSAGLSLGAATPVEDVSDAPEEVVVMFVDIVDSTRLTYEYGDKQFRAITARLDRKLRQTVNRHGGTVIEAINVGDGLLADTPSPAEALACAVECIDVATKSGLALHVGLNIGPVVRDRSNVFGTTVNVAARVTARTAPNEILVTEPLVRRSARPLRCFTDRGLSELKGIPDPVRLFAYTP